MTTKKKLREMGPAHGAPVKWKVTFERPDGSTDSRIVLAQTAFLARKQGALELGKLASEVTLKLLTPEPPKEQKDP